MNSTLLKPFLFQKKLRKLRSLPKDSDERIIIIEDLMEEVKRCLLEKSDDPVEKLLSSRYICPFLHHVHEEKNIVKIADTIVMAFVQPKTLHNFRFAVSIADSTQKLLIRICDQSFRPYIKTEFQGNSQSLTISFTSI